MRWAAVSKRERRIVALGALAIGVLFSTKALPLWQSKRLDARATADESEQAVRLAHNIVGAEKWLRDSATSRGSQYLELAARLLNERSVGAAGAELAELINESAAGVGLRVGTTHVLGDTAHLATFQQVAVRTAVTGDIAGVMRLLASVEGNPIALAIRELTITQMNIASSDREPEMLRAELTVAALMRPNGAQ